MRGKIDKYMPKDFSAVPEEMEQTRSAPVSDSPRLRSPVYAYNDTHLEMRAGCMEYARGLVTIVSLFFVYITIGFFHLSFIALFKFISTPSFSWLLAVIFEVVLAGVFTWLYVKYGFQITRFEMLTQRRLLVRFNRKTQQVYLHRPKYAGGVTVLPWGKFVAEVDAGGTRFPILLAWPPQPGRPNMDLCFVGKACATSGPMRDEWEFIRRYMEEGPEGLPQPRIHSKWPLPWHAFGPVFGGMLGLLLGRREGQPSSGSALDTQQIGKRLLGRLLMLVALVIISPALLTLGLANWLSQLLCWEPRWPKVIREAGQPGKPIPKLTTAEDYDPETCRRLYLNADLWTPKGHDGIAENDNPDEPSDSQ
ncbi:DUF6708 domain-containing protein [Alloalcanivorax xenomutans]|uniref:DUF6708 domain-containing protein n=1 Tax=Alloalcanivorax xenomutans TaxID=1094342 RepID=UPI0011783FE6|nr:DUF6708 domain-containing protein [Alloalcanivorax xenomutans]